ncbi:MAG: 2-C-methyl-D-erythritol 2,4-cyclodiphosphate synthase [Spirochaetales bacterium]|nr:2-C-methyl-D-erythritol 2,4-cyclodiphosphate synthase [Spirochaetales bacterium]MCF7937363.1 2-C-methyl-D-erythritol 2,4-cyclodiphosphate synthase [Spirochaetales bacterium]
MDLRIGHGWDLHRLVPDRRLRIGGCTIPAPLGEAGHSDGDALIHSIIDAFFGAACLGDIGTHFPPSDPAYQDIDSSNLLEKSLQLLAAEGFCPYQLDTTVILEEPRLGPYIHTIRTSLSSILSLEKDRVSVKAKSREGLRFESPPTQKQTENTGAPPVIEAFAVVLIVPAGQNL